MKTGFLSLILFFSSLLLATAQSSGSAVQGTNSNSDAPVNVAEPSLRPAQPATYSATSIPDSQKGQFYVKDDKPAYADYTPVQPDSPATQEARKKMQALKDAENKAADKTKATSQPQLPKKGKAASSKNANK